jgi:hypothetical protein
METHDRQIIDPGGPGPDGETAPWLEGPRRIEEGVGDADRRLLRSMPRIQQAVGVLGTNGEVPGSQAVVSGGQAADDDDIPAPSGWYRRGQGADHLVRVDPIQLILVVVSHACAPPGHP